MTCAEPKNDKGEGKEKGRLYIDVAALIVSIIAIGISINLSSTTLKEDRKRRASEICLEFFVGPLLADDHKTIRDWRIANLPSDPTPQQEEAVFSTLPDEVRVAFSRSYNFLEIVLLAADNTAIDRDTVLQCLSVSLRGFCDDHKKIFEETRFIRLERSCEPFDKTTERRRPRHRTI